QGGPVRSAPVADGPRRRLRPSRPEAMTQSLRGRLLVGVISLLVVGLLISDVATYVTLQNSLLGRVDDQLRARSTVITAVAVLSNPQCQMRGPGSAAEFPRGH